MPSHIPRPPRPHLTPTPAAPNSSWSTPARPPADTPRTLSCTLALLSSLSRMNCLATALWPVARWRSILTLPYRPVPVGRA